MLHLPVEQQIAADVLEVVPEVVALGEVVVGIDVGLQPRHERPTGIVEAVVLTQEARFGQPAGNDGSEIFVPSQIRAAQR